MIKQKLIIASVSAGMLLAGCSKPVVQQTAQQTTTAQAEPVFKGVGLDMANIDKTVSPCDNFFLYANGGWLKNNPVPSTESRWGSFDELAKKNNATLRSIVEEAAGNTSAEKGTTAQKVGDFYASGMDSVTIDKAGITPLNAELARIDKIKDTNGVLAELAHHQMYRTGALFGFYVGQDDKNSTQYAVNFYQGGLSLPDRDYYLKTDKRSQTIREEYLKFLQNMFKLMGDTEAKAKQNAGKVMAMETRLAKASMTRVQQRDPYATYNKMTLAEAQKMAPNLKWATLLQNMQVKNVNDVIIGQPEFFKEASAMLKSVPVADWKTYLRWHLVRSSAPALSQPFVQESFNFYSKTLSGAKEMQPRWKRILRSTDGALGELLGQLYIEKAFSAEAKVKALAMVNNLRAAFQEHVGQIDWMSDETKKQALRKLDAFAVKIGYPDKWKDYTTLEVSRQSYVQNLMNSRLFAYNEMINKLGKPVDRTEWGMTPSTVNAYYNPSMNEIVFPAGILQPPFFDPKADDAVNYGGMGAVIGHELTHGFDDQGRQYDAEGNLKEWWTEEDAKKFIERTAIVEKQYGRFEALDSLFVNPKLTMGENIADIGGLNIAYTALQRAIKDKNVGKIDGLNQDQRFFLAWAQIWRINATDQYLMQQVATDPHSPGKFRTNGPLANMEEFHKAFGCKPGDKMYLAPEERVKIW